MKIRFTMKKLLLLMIPINIALIANAILASSLTCHEFIFNFSWGPFYGIICV